MDLLIILSNQFSGSYFKGGILVRPDARSMVAHQNEAPIDLGRPEP